MRNWARWGEEDDRGTLNYITAEHVRTAAGLVRSGQSVTLSLPMNMVAGPDNPRPSIHHMVKMYDLPLSARGEPHFAGDFLATEVHGDSSTHVDALCHVAYKGKPITADRPVSLLPRGRRGRTSRPMSTESSVGECC